MSIKKQPVIETSLYPLRIHHFFILLLLPTLAIAQEAAIKGIVHNEKALGFSEWASVSLWIPYWYHKLSMEHSYGALCNHYSIGTIRPLSFTGDSYE